MRGDLSDKVAYNIIIASTFQETASQISKFSVVDPMCADKRNKIPF